MAFAQLPSYPQFDCKSEGVSTRWTKWISRLKNNLFVAYGITDEEQKRALTLTYGGDELCDIVESLPTTETSVIGNESPFDKLVTALNNFFNPRVNKEIQRYTFRHTTQQTDSIDEFYTELRQLASTCEFNSADDEIKSQLITGCKSSKVREKGLTNPTMSLHELLQFARTTEVTQKHSKTFMNDKLSASMNKIRISKTHQKTPKMGNSNSKCRNCGKSWPHPGGPRACPAFDKRCNNCNKMNHFATMCQSKPHQPIHKQGGYKKQFRKKNQNVRTIVEQHDDSDSEDTNEYVYTSSTKSNFENMPLFNVKINGNKVKLLADSGASINILSLKDLKAMSPQPKLTPCMTKIFAFSSNTPLPVIGKFNATASYGKCKLATDFAVIDTNDVSVLGWKACQALHMINKNMVHKITTDINNITDEFHDLFEGIGKLKDCKVKLHIDEQVPPVAQRYRRIPFHMRKQLEDYLEKEEKKGVIEKATGPTPWVSPIVIVPKPKSPDKIRVCVDMRAPNKAIKRERHNAPTLDELATTLNGATCFGKLDLNQGYNQIELDEESRYITTFATHKGLYRYKRLSFGVNSAAEIFQEKIRQALNGLEGAINVSDDLLVHGTSDEHHDQNLKLVLQRLREKNLTLNKEKCEYRKNSIEFLGHIFSADGVKPSPNKIKAIMNMEPPKNKSEVRSLLGMLNFCGARFIPDYASLTFELRKLTHDKTPFTWTDKHENAMKTLKKRLQGATNLVYFDPTKEIEIYVDASPVGISGILTQLDNQQNT